MDRNETRLLTLTDIEFCTAEAGETWAVPHIQRLLALIPRIAEDRPYEQETLTWAAWLHDWGAFSRYAQPGVDHALRSRQVAEGDILPQADFPAEKIPLLLEIIEHHDYRDATPAACFEMQLFREADFLDFLGAVGMAREFAWGPGDLSVVARRIRSRMGGIRGRFTLPVAQAMAEARLAEMETFLASLREEGLGTVAC
ncbi:MAG: hypothetical protein HPY85_11470 [Anaerolineae bacterium]|nr:hypothetical protein [Anaerolineae bacterium]